MSFSKYVNLCLCSAGAHQAHAGVSLAEEQTRPSCFVLVSSSVSSLDNFEAFQLRRGTCTAVFTLETVDARVI